METIELIKFEDVTSSEDEQEEYSKLIHELPSKNMTDAKQQNLSLNTS